MMKAVLSPLSTHTDIVNPSPAMTDEGMPIYYNTASFYAQEIPDCDPNDETCEPIKHEKTDLEAVIEGDFTSKPSIDPGIIEGEINRYSSVDFQKLGRTSDDSDESAIPLAGAVFTVYKANEDGTRGDIAIAKDGTKLENLVTNDEGKLCLADDEGNPNEAVILSLERGNYIFVEVNTPEGYVHPEGESNETLVTVGLIGNDVDVVNIKDKKANSCY